MSLFSYAIRGDATYFKSIHASDVLKNSIDEEGDSLLSKAAEENHLNCCKVIYRKCPALLYHQNNDGNTALHSAALKAGPEVVEFLITAESRIDLETGETLPDKKLLTMVNKCGDTALHMAVQNGNTEVMKLLIDADLSKDLLTMVNWKKDTALHLAVENGNLEITKLLIEADTDKELLRKINWYEDTVLHLAMKNDNLEIMKSLVAAKPGNDILRRTNWHNDTVLHLAVKSGKVETAKLLIDADPDKEILRMGNWNKDTPLHLAVKFHYLDMVNLLIEAETDFEYGVNVSGKTPLLIAMEEAQHYGSTSGHDSAKIRIVLLHKLPSQCRVRTGENGWTVLHHATSKGDLNAIKDITDVCSNCSEIFDNQGQSFLHLAAKLELVEVVKHILGTVELTQTVLNGKDKDGNTPLHIAVLSGNSIMAKYFLYDPRVNKNTMNIKRQKVLDAINFTYDKEKAGVSEKDIKDEIELRDQGGFDIIVGALIATISFTAGVTLPGGYINDGPNQGMVILSRKTSFEIFVISNTFSLMFSLYAIFSHFSSRFLVNKKEIDNQITAATSCLIASILTMIVAFIAGSYAVLEIQNGLAISVSVICSTFFIFAFWAFWRMVMPSVYHSSFKLS